MTGEKPAPSDAPVGGQRMPRPRRDAEQNAANHGRAEAEDQHPARAETIEREGDGHLRDGEGQKVGRLQTRQTGRVEAEIARQIACHDGEEGPIEIAQKVGKQQRQEHESKLPF